jgi:hypothetical protein
MGLRQGPVEAEELRVQGEQEAAGQVRHLRLEVEAARAARPVEPAADSDLE